MNLKNLLSLTCVFPIAFATHSFGSSANNTNEPFLNDTLSQHSYQNEYDYEIGNDFNDDYLNFRKPHYPTPDKSSDSSDSSHSDSEMYDHHRHNHFKNHLSCGHDFRHELQIQLQKKEDDIDYITRFENLNKDIDQMQKSLLILKTEKDNLGSLLTCTANTVEKNKTDHDKKIYNLQREVKNRHQFVRLEIQKIGKESQALLNSNIKKTREELVKEMEDKYNQLNNAIENIDTLLGIQNVDTMVPDRLVSMESEVSNLRNSYANLIQRIGHPSSLDVLKAFKPLPQKIEAPTTLESLLQCMAQNIEFINETLKQYIADSIDGALTQLNNTDKSQNIRIASLEDGIKETNATLNDFKKETTKKHETMLGFIQEEVNTQVNSQETDLKIYGMVQNKVYEQITNNMSGVTDPLKKDIKEANERINNTNERIEEVNTTLTTFLTTSQKNENNQNATLQDHLKQIHTAQTDIDDHSRKLEALETEKNDIKHDIQAVILRAETTNSTIQQHRSELLNKLQDLDEAVQKADQTLEENLNKGVRDINQNIGAIDQKIANITNFIGEIPTPSVSEAETLVQRITELKNDLANTISRLKENFELTHSNTANIEANEHRINEIQMQNEQHNETFEAFKTSTNENLEGKQHAIELLTTSEEETKGRLRTAEEQLGETNQSLEDTISNMKKIEATGNQSVEDINQLNTNLEATKGDLASLTELTGTVKAQGESNLEAINLLKDDHETTKSNLEQTTENLSALTATTTTLQSTSQEHTNKISDIEASIDTINTENTNLDAANRLSTLESFKTETQETLNNLDKSLATLTNTVNTNQTELSETINANKESAEKSIESINSSITEHGTKLQELTEKLTQHEETSSKNLETLDNLVTQHTESLNTLSSGFEKHSTDIETLTTDLTNLDTKIDTTKESMTKMLADEVDPLKSELNTAKSDIAQNKVDIGNNNIEISTAKQNIEKIQNDITDMTSTMEKIETIATSNQSSLQEFEKTQLEITSDITKLKENVDKFTLADEDHLQKIGDHLQKIEELRTLLNEAKSAIESELTTLKDTTIPELNGRIDANSAALTELNTNTISNLNQRIDDANTALNTAKSELNQNIADLETTIQEKTAALINASETTLNEKITKNSDALDTLNTTTIPDLNTTITDTRDALLETVTNETIPAALSAFEPTLNDKINALENKLNTEIQKNSDALKLLNTTTISDLNTEIQKNSDALKLLNTTTISDLNTEIQKNSAAVTELTAFKNTTTPILETINTTIPGLEQRVGNLQTNITELENTTQGLDVTALQDQIDQHKTDTSELIVGLTDDIKGLTTQIEGLKTAIKGLPALTTQVTDLSRDVTNLSNEVKALKETPADNGPATSV